MLSDTDTAKADMKKKERIFKEKESFVLMVHRTDDGVPRKINEPKPGAKGQTGLWNTKMSDGKRPTSKTYEGLIEKLYELYGGLYHHQSYKIIDVWEEALAEYQREGFRELKSVENQRKEFKRIATPEFLEMDMRKITVKWLEGFLRGFIVGKYEEGKPIKQKAFLNIKSALNILFCYAVKEGMLPSNPAIEIKPTAFQKYLDFSIHDRSRSAVLHTESQYESFFAEIENHKNHPQFGGYYVYHLMAKVQAISGLRPGELCTLKWKDVIDGLLFVRSQQRLVPANKETGEGRKYLDIPYTKNARVGRAGGRALPYAGPLMDAIEEARSLQKAFGIESAYIFSDKTGNPVKKDQYSDAVTATFRKLKMPTHGTYTFRRIANDRFKKAGFDEKDRGYLLGNTSGVNNSCYTFENEEVVENARSVFNAMSPAWK